jgi:hypothetical protein
MSRLIRNIAQWVFLAPLLLWSAASANAQCVFQSISYGQTVSGSLSATDCVDNLSSAFYVDRYQFTGAAGDKVVVQMSSTSFDNWLVLRFPSGKFTNNDNGGGGTNARIPATSGYYTLPESGTYVVEATSYVSNKTGSYTLSLAKEALGTEGMLNVLGGWNLLGNSSSVALNVASAFGDSSKVNTVWKWNASKSNWTFYTPTQADGGAAYAASKGFDLMTSVAGGEGFWVHAKTPFTVALPTGPMIDSTSFKTLPPQWSLIATGDNKTPSAFNSALSTTAPAAGQLPENFNSLWAWDTALAKWYLYVPSLEATGGLASYIQAKGYLDFAATNKKLGPGVGFWVNKPGASGAGGTPFVSPVSPSSASQTIISTDNTVSVTIPGGLLNTSQQLKVTKLSSPPAQHFDWLEVGGAYDIQLGDLHQFNQELTVRMKYDPAKLRTDIPIESNISAAYWDPILSAWVAVPMQLDQSSHEVIVKTKHLSFFTWYMKRWGFDVYFKNHFNIVYSPAVLVPLELSGGGYYNGDRSNYANVSIPTYAEDAMAFLIDAYRIYVDDYKFKPPSSPMDVFVGTILGFDISSFTEKFTGVMLIDSTANNANQLKLQTAHELFHRVQNAYYYDIGGMTTQTWWLEATADYAGDVLAWKGLQKMGGGDIKPHYLEAPLHDTGELHNLGYATAHFIKFLVDKGANFKNMWEATAAYPDALFGLDLYLKGVHGKDRGLAALYHDFAKYFVFDANSPLPTISSSLHSEVAAYQSTLSVSSKSDTVTLDLGSSYTAKLWGIRLSDALFDKPGQKLNYQVSLKGTLPATNVELDVFVLKGDRRLAGGATPIGTLSPTKSSVDIVVEKGDLVYVLGVNMSFGNVSIPVEINDGGEIKVTWAYSQYDFVDAQGKQQYCTTSDSGYSGLGAGGQWSGTTYSIKTTESYGSFTLLAEFSTDYAVLKRFSYYRYDSKGLLDGMGEVIDVALNRTLSTPGTSFFTLTGSQGIGHVPKFSAPGVFGGCKEIAFTGGPVPFFFGLQLSR